MSCRLVILVWLVVAGVALIAGGCGHRRGEPGGSPDGASGSGVETVAKSGTLKLSDSGEIRGARRSDREGVLAAELVQGDQKGDWASEAFHEQIKPRLVELGRLMTASGGASSTSSYAELATPEFAGGSLRPERLAVVQNDRATTVFRGEAAAQTTQRGPDGLAAAVGELLGRYDVQAESPTFYFKTFRVHVSGDRGESSSYLDLDGRARPGVARSADVRANERVQTTATWHCQWRRESVDKPWRLAGIRVEDFEDVVYRSPTRKLFADCTEAAFAKEKKVYDEHLRHGLNHWRLRLESALGVDFSGHHGLAVGDVNGDELDDLYYCDLGGLPNRLFVQNADGTLRDASAEAGVDFLDRTRAALLVDLDNDADQDLVVSFSRELLVMSNDGSGRFRKEATLAVHPIAHSITAIDYDADGDLDLYSCDYGSDNEQFGDNVAPLPWHDANNGAPNVLFRNDGGWKFADVTREVGLDHNNRKYSFAASWEDFDNDGDFDLYVANDFGRKNLYRNDEGKFRDVAREIGADDLGPGMSAAWADYNNDGWMDLYVGNMFSGAGNRITYQERFKPGSGDVVGDYQRFARGNTLLKNRGDGTFEDVSVGAGVTVGRWAWTSLFVDINNDGWQDLFVANGYVTGDNPDDL